MATIGVLAGGRLSVISKISNDIFVMNQCFSGTKQYLCATKPYLYTAKPYLYTTKQCLCATKQCLNYLQPRFKPITIAALRRSSTASHILNSVIIFCIFRCWTDHPPREKSNNRQERDNNQQYYQCLIPICLISIIFIVIRMTNKTVSNESFLMTAR